MSIRKTLIVVAIAASAAPAAFANSGSTWVGGEVGFVNHPVQARTRAEVKAELQEFLRNGGKLPSGEAGVYVPAAHEHTYVFEDARRVHADQLNTMGNTAAPRVPTRFERMDPYMNGGPN